MGAASGEVAHAYAKEPLFSFGVIADVQYADIPNGHSVYGVPRYYRHSLTVLRRAVARWNAHGGGVRFSLNFGDIVDMHCPRDSSRWTVEKIVVEFDKFGGGPTYHMIGNHGLYSLPRSELLPLLTMPATVNDGGGSGSGPSCAPFSARGAEDLYDHILCLEPSWSRDNRVLMGPPIPWTLHAAKIERGSSRSGL